jgi:hypothetical protein
MPLAVNRSLITRRLQTFRKGILPTVKTIRITNHPVHMSIGSGQNTGPTRKTQGVGVEYSVQTHPLSRNAVDVGRKLAIAAAVATDRVAGMVIGNNKNNIGSGRLE